ncbi:MAG: hypothetical protein RLZZ172_340 [Bacteroidota bacterium]|jgi:hypothetical protein
MIMNVNIKLEEYIPNDEELKIYAQFFKEAFPKWFNFEGASIFMDINGKSVDAEEIIANIKKSTPIQLLSILKKYKALPKKLYRITENSTRNSENLPIYTGIREISLDNECSILAEAFFGIELHLLNAAGGLISSYDYKCAPELGVGQIIRKNLDDSIDQAYDDDVPDTYWSNEAIIDYSKNNLRKSYSFPSQKGEIYYVNKEFQTTEVIHATGDFVNLSSIHSLGWHQISNVSPDELPSGNENEKFFHFHVGLEWKEISDFTIQYNTFPFLNGRDNWILQHPILNKEEIYKLFYNKCKDDLFILDQLKNDPCSFQFMPTEILSDIFWVEKFCLIEPVNFLFVDNILRNNITFVTDLIGKTDRNKNTIYPYLPEQLRKNLDILMVMKKLCRLFDLPDKNDIGSSKIDDIRSFILDNKSSLKKIIEIFPNVIQYIPNEIYLDDNLPF